MATCSAPRCGQARQARLLEGTLQRDKSLGKKNTQGGKGKEERGGKKRVLLVFVFKAADENQI